MCILSVYTLLKVVSYYDLSVPFNVSDGFPKKLDGYELYPVLFWIIGICLKSCKAPHQYNLKQHQMSYFNQSSVLLKTASNA